MRVGRRVQNWVIVRALIDIYENQASRGASAPGLFSSTDSLRRAMNSNISTTKSTKESDNETLDAILQPDVVKSVNLNGRANHGIGTVVELHLRALRVLRGDFLLISTEERQINRHRFRCPVLLPVRSPGCQERPH